MTFSADIARFKGKLAGQVEQIFVGGIALTKTSIVHGSPITGAPGQPEASGALADSWRDERDGDRATILTGHPGAPTIEAGTREGRALVLHGSGGGFHSLELTRTGWPRIVDTVASEVAGG